MYLLISKILLVPIELIRECFYTESNNTENMIGDNIQEESLLPTAVVLNLTYLFLFFKKNHQNQNLNDSYM